MTITLKDYLETEQEDLPNYQITKTQINIQNIYKGEYRPKLARKTLLELLGHYRDRIEWFHAFFDDLDSTFNSLDMELEEHEFEISNDLERNLEKYPLCVESSKTASERRTFLQSQLIRTKKDRGELNIQKLKMKLEAKAQRDPIISDYIAFRAISELTKDPNGQAKTTYQ